jgi:hypothetical protein
VAHSNQVHGEQATYHLLDIAGSEIRRWSIQTRSSLVSNISAPNILSSTNHRISGHIFIRGATHKKADDSYLIALGPQYNKWTTSSGGTKVSTMERADYPSVDDVKYGRLITADERFRPVFDQTTEQRKRIQDVFDAQDRAAKRRRLTTQSSLGLPSAPLSRSNQSIAQGSSSSGSGSQAGGSQAGGSHAGSQASLQDGSQDGSSAGSASSSRSNTPPPFPASRQFSCATT